MSDTSEETLQSERNGEKDDYLCRDFSRGLCDRRFCKYKHENEIKPLNFCHDFQNFVCPRSFCKFIHCTLEEVDEYKRTGQMSPQIVAEATRKNQLPGTPPACNQFKKGQCRRTFCKFRHITKEQEEAEIVEMVQNNGQRKAPQVIFNNNNIITETQLVTLESLGGVLRRNGVNFEEYKADGLPLIKRRFVAAQEPEILCDIMEQNGTRPLFKGYFASNPPSTMLSRADARTLMLEEENQLLHKEIAQLKKQVSDLTATNEFLLDQNANLRVGGPRSGTVNLPAVTITNTPTQVNRTVIASVATVPVSLATVSTVSGNHSVSIAGCPTVSMAPAQILANSQQILVTTNPTTHVAIANSSQAQLAINSSQAQLAIAQQNLATNLAAAQQAAQAQPQLTSQAQQLALATTTQQLTSQAQHIANQQIAMASAAAGPQLATQQQQITAQAQQLALAGTTQQLTSQAQQLALASTNQQLNNQPQQLTVTNVPQHVALASTNQQLLAQQNLASEMHRNSQMNAISTSQAIAMSNSAPQSMVSYPIMTQSMNHALSH